MTRPVSYLLTAACALTLLSGAVADVQAATPQRELAVCADPANLPFSDRDKHGFENRIASLIAEELHAKVRYTWEIQRRGFLRRTLKSGACDVVMGASPGLPGVEVTRPYYGSSYVFVSRRESGLKLGDLDDPTLRDLKIGLHAIASNGANTPPATALARRGIVENIVGFPMWGEDEVEAPQGRIIDAVAHGDIDTAIVWGPLAGFFAKRYGEQLVITPVSPDPQMPQLPFAYDISIGVREGDEKLLAELQAVLDRRQQDIAAILKDFGVPQNRVNDSAAQLSQQ